MTSGRSWITRDRNGACAVNIFVTPARDQKADACRDNDVLREQGAPFKSSAAIKREIIAGMIGEKNEFGVSCIDGLNVIHVHVASQFRCVIRFHAVADED